MNYTRFMATLVLIVLCLTVIAGTTPADSPETSGRDSRLIQVQEICPTSGMKLGSHGTPIKVRVGELTIFLCCKGCLNEPIKPEHWATIHANFARAQKICPVMEHELPKNPKWTIVEGQIIYVCCPPCTDKIDDAPKSYLEKIDALYSASLTAEAKQR